MFLLLCIVMIWPALVLFFYLTDTDRNRNKSVKQYKQQLAKQSKPESGHLRSETKKASDLAWRSIPSQREIKRRAGQNRDTEPYYVDEKW